MRFCSHCKTLTATPCTKQTFGTCVRYLKPTMFNPPAPKLPTIDAFMAKMLTTVGPTIRAITPGSHFSFIVWVNDPLDPGWKVHVATSAEQEEMMSAFTAMLEQWRKSGKMKKPQ